MTKKELIEKVSVETGLSKKEAFAAVEETFAAITGALENGETVTIPNFGVFSVKTRKAFTGHNPLTGEAVEVPEKKSPHFKPYTVLKNIVGDKQ